MCPWTFEKILPVNPKSAREQPKKCPWNSNLPVNNFKKKCPWTYENCPWTSEFCVFLLLFVKKCPWTSKSVRENFQKSVRERTLKCPWKRLKKCPWTHSLTREHSPKSAREPKKVPVNIVQKMGFTGTFDVHGEKKNTALTAQKGFFTTVTSQIANSPPEMKKLGRIFQILHSFTKFYIYYDSTEQLFREQADLDSQQT